MNDPQLNKLELARYARHLVLPEVGADGQQRLKRARVLVVGAGGLGSPVLMYLAAAGVGTLGIAEFDRVDVSNLQRQVLYDEEDRGRPKLEAAIERLPHITLRAHAERLDAENAMEVLSGYDLVVDGTDNFSTRYLLNDACALQEKPLVYGSIFRFEGQVSLFWKGRGPCYRCIFPEPPPPGAVPNCAEGGVLGVLPGIVGTLQANEALKWILGRGEALLGRLLLFDALETRFRELRVGPDPDCPLCGERPSIERLIDYDAFCGTGQVAAQPVEENNMTVRELKERMDRKEDLLLLDVREPAELQVSRIEGSLTIPMGDVPGRLDELDRDREIVVHCKSGGRSAKVVQFLVRQGYERVHNLEGGINAWAEEIDPKLPTY